MLKIRSAIENDVASINTIINDYIQHTSVIFDLDSWELEKRLSWFNHFDFKKYFIYVAALNNQVIGFAYNSRFMEKQAYDISSEVSIYLSRDKTFHKQGIGNKLYTSLLEKLKQTDLHRLYARIALPNEASIQLHLKHGFKEIGTLNQCGYKFDQYIDVALLEKKMIHQ